MNVEEEHLDVLQNIEFAIVNTYKRNLSLVDFDVDAALNALIGDYQARARGGAPRPMRLNERARAVYDAVKAICDWRLGEDVLVTASGAPGPRPEPVSLDVIIACLKRIRKSVELWNRKGGRQGYLTFIQRFIP